MHSVFTILILTTLFGSGTIVALSEKYRRLVMNTAYWHILRKAIPLALLLAAQACYLGTNQPVLPAGTSLPTAVASKTTAGTSTSTLLPTNSPIPPTPTITPTLMPVVYPIGPSGFPPDVDPLTGLRVSDPAILDRRPLAIKVSNFPRTARLVQDGLSKVDLLWEFYTEYGNTRFIAMYYGQDAEKVGPIRSARIMDTRIVTLYDAILVHVQAFEAVWEVISKAGIDTINEFPASCPAICRDPSVQEVENSAFGNTIALTKYAKTIGLLSGGRPNLDGMMFDLKPTASGTPSIGAWIQFAPYTLAEWKYAPASNRYLRFSEKGDTLDMVPLIDHSTDEQVAVDNVVILFAPIKRFYSDKPTNGELWDVDLSGSGQAFFFRDGTIVEGKWKSGGAGSPLQFLTQGGELFPLHPGSTYIGLLSDRGSGGHTASTEWKFYDSH
jgi:hypothetical protein